VFEDPSDDSDIESPKLKKRSFTLGTGNLDVGNANSLVQTPDGSPTPLRRPKMPPIPLPQRTRSLDDHGTGSPRRKQYRLSIPPSIRLAPKLPQSFSDSMFPLPHKHNTTDWHTLTPSPVRSSRDGIRTPPLRRGGHEGLQVRGLGGSWSMDSLTESLETATVRLKIRSSTSLVLFKLTLFKDTDETIETEDDEDDWESDATEVPTERQVL